MIIKQRRPRRHIPKLKTVLRRKQNVGLTQGGSSSRYGGAKPGANHGEKEARH